MPIIVRSAMVVVLACAAACGVATGQGSGAMYAEKDPYIGKVSAQVLVPGGSRDPDKEFGTGSAQFVQIGGDRNRLVVKANIRRANDSGFVIEGRGDGSGWSGRSGSLRIEIDRNGNISGGGVENDHRITFDGRATARRIELVVETEKLSKTGDETLLPGTRILFEYDLARAEDVTMGGPAAAKKTEKTCKRRVWKMRNVATPGGGMTMTQVPHCLD